MGVPTITLANGAGMPQLGFGTWQLPGDTVITPLTIALELGYTHIDTAEIYENHEAIGQVIRQHPREKLFITSKVWRDDLGYEETLIACERALEELGTDYLDLYLIHWPSPTPVGETLRAFEELVRAGKVRSVGVSNFTIRHLKEALRVAKVPITVNQVELHPWLFQRDLIAFCRKNRIAVTAYSPLSRGRFLNNPVLDRIARAHSRTPAQVCLRWAVQHDLIAIPKASSRKHIDENRKIFDFSLSREEMAELDSLPQSRIVQPSFAEF